MNNCWFLLFFFWTIVFSAFGPISQTVKYSSSFLQNLKNLVHGIKFFIIRLSWHAVYPWSRSRVFFVSQLTWCAELTFESNLTKPRKNTFCGLQMCVHMIIASILHRDQPLFIWLRIAGLCVTYFCWYHFECSDEVVKLFLQFEHIFLFITDLNSRGKHCTGFSVDQRSKRLASHPAFMSKFTTPEDLEKYHVRHVYNQIAPHFVGSRHKAWPKVEEFLLSLPAGSVIADVGKFGKDFLWNLRLKGTRRNIEHQG